MKRFFFIIFFILGALFLTNLALAALWEPCEVPPCSCSGSCTGCPAGDYYSDGMTCDGVKGGTSCTDPFDCSPGIDCLASPAYCHVDYITESTTYVSGYGCAIPNTAYMVDVTCSTTSFCKCPASPTPPPCVPSCDHHRDGCGGNKPWGIGKCGDLERPDYDECTDTCGGHWYENWSCDLDLASCCSLPGAPTVTISVSGNESTANNRCGVSTVKCTNDTTPTWNFSDTDPGGQCDIDDTNIFENGSWQEQGQKELSHTPSALSHNNCYRSTARFENEAGWGPGGNRPWAQVDIQGPPIPAPEIQCLSNTVTFSWTAVRNDNGCAGLPSDRYFYEVNVGGTLYSGWTNQISVSFASSCDQNATGRVKSRDNFGNTSGFSSTLSVTCSCATCTSEGYACCDVGSGNRCGGPQSAYDDDCSGANNLCCQECTWCGDGIVQSTFGEACDPPGCLVDGTSCSGSGCCGSCVNFSCTGGEPVDCLYTGICRNDCLCPTPTASQTCVGQGYVCCGDNLCRSEQSAYSSSCSGSDRCCISCKSCGDNILDSGFPLFEECDPPGCKVNGTSCGSNGECCSNNCSGGTCQGGASCSDPGTCRSGCYCPLPVSPSPSPCANCNQSCSVSNDCCDGCCGSGACCPSCKYDATNLCKTCYNTRCRNCSNPDATDCSCPAAVTCQSQGYTCCDSASCNNEHSSYNSDCSGGEVCCDSCTVTTCQSQGYVCCDSGFCNNEHSSYNSDCSGGEVCCDSCITCGNGVIDWGEECDPPGGYVYGESCSSDGQCLSGDCSNLTCGGVPYCIESEGEGACESDCQCPGPPSSPPPPPSPPPQHTHVRGRFFIDSNRNGKKDASESILSGDPRNSGISIQQRRVSTNTWFNVQDTFYYGDDICCRDSAWCPGVSSACCSNNIHDPDPRGCPGFGLYDGGGWRSNGMGLGNSYQLKFLSSGAWSFSGHFYPGFGGWTDHCNECNNPSSDGTYQNSSPEQLYIIVVSAPGDWWLAEDVWIGLTVGAGSSPTPTPPSLSPLPSASPSASPCTDTQPAQVTLNSPGGTNASNDYYISTNYGDLSWQGILNNQWGVNCSGSGNDNRYVVYMGTDNNPFDEGSIGSYGSGPGTHTHTFTGLSWGQRYYWGIRTSNEGSAPSDPLHYAESPIYHFTPLQVDPWWQTVGGDIHADNRVGTNIPASTCSGSCKPYLSLSDRGTCGIVSYGRNINLGRDCGGPCSPNNIAQNGTNWNAQTAYYGEEFNYAWWTSHLRDETKRVLNPGYLPNSGNQTRVYESSGTLNITGGNVRSNAKMIVLHSGNVNILGDITVQNGSFLMVVASGNISIANTVGNVEGMFLADNNFDVGTGDTHLYAEGTFVGWRRFYLGRDFMDGSPPDPLRNSTEPAMTFTFRPDFLINAPDTVRRIFYPLWQHIPS